MIQIETELFKIYCFWGALLALKMYMMFPLTAFQRFTKRIFMNPEDCTALKGSKVVHNDPDIERVRRAHRNDMENILPWFFITAIWLTTSPPLWLAQILIPTFAICRYVHTIVYCIIPQQPARAITFFIGISISAFQAFNTVFHYL